MRRRRRGQALIADDPRSVRTPTVINREAWTTLPPSTASVPTARSFVDTLLDDWGCPASPEVAQLLTSELVTNAVLHAGSPLRLHVTEDDRGLVVEVEDEEPGLPVLQRPPPGATAGRGLMLVEALAEDWGVEPEGMRKRVWFRLEAR